VKGVSQGLTGKAIPALNQLSAGLSAAAAQLTNTTTGGAFAINALAGALGCPTSTPPGFTGPIVGPTNLATTFGCQQPITVAGNPSCASPLGGTAPCNVVVNAILGGISGAGALDRAGLTQSLYAPLAWLDTDPPSLDPAKTGLAALLGQFYPSALATVSAALGDQIVGQQPGAAYALNELLKVVTSNPAGNPDPNTANGNTATGILNELRAALGQGGVGTNGVPGQCAGYNTPGNPSSGLNMNASQAQITATCAAADVLNLALLVSDALETGVSTTLLEGISDQLVTSVQPLVVGANKLADGSSQLAAGLPAAVDGVGQIKTDAAGGLKEAGNDAAEDFGRRVALYEAMNNPDLVSKYIPGGAPQGDDISYNGVYKFELAGVGSESNSTTTLALAVLGLAAAAGVGAFAGSRAKAA
jgi:X-X-X-Leu-X-X-Gly heptad repeat protein